jgi:hypothetical protein
LLFASFASHAAAPAGRYNVNAGAGIVTDNVTGLVWQRTVGWDETIDMVTYCQSLNLGGWSSGWRVPTMKELESLVDVRGHNPAMDTTAFPGAQTQIYWSSTPLANGTQNTLIVDFLDGSTGYKNNTLTGYMVRCVH